VIEGVELGVGDVTFLNSRRETIFLIEFREVPIRTVSRESAEGRTQVIEIPEGFTLERVRLEVDRIKKGGESYLRTPSRCPAQERWINAGRILYRDGLEQSERLATPCVR
jgi:hypothetical protein